MKSIKVTFLYAEYPFIKSMGMASFYMPKYTRDYAVVKVLKSNDGRKTFKVPKNLFRQMLKEQAILGYRAFKVEIEKYGHGKTPLDWLQESDKLTNIRATSRAWYGVKITSLSIWDIMTMRIKDA